MNKNKTIIITGASRGIGFDLAKKLLVNSFNVINLSKNSNSNITNLKKKYKKNFFSHKCNISDPKDVEIFFKKISKFKNIYGLVNNAGINPSRNRVHETSINDWVDTINTNLNGAFYCSNYFLKNVIKSKNEAVIINIASIAGMVSLKKRASYSTSKGGLISLTKSIATDYAKNNIRSFCLCPGYIETDLTKPYLKSLGKKEYSNLLSKHKLNRLGKPNDVSNLVLYLLSKDSNWMTGNIIQIDGGYIV